MAKNQKKDKPEPTPEQIQFIKTEFASVVEAGRKGLDHAVACGEALNNIKKNTRHGKWEDWVVNVAGIPIRTATRYRSLADNQVELQAAADAGFNFGVRNAMEVLEEYRLSLLSDKDRKAAEAKKVAEQAERDATAEKEQKAAVEAAAKEYIQEHPELVVPVVPLPTPDLTTQLQGRPDKEICVALCSSMEVEDLFKLASGIVRNVLGRTDITPEQWRVYKKGLVAILEAAKTPPAEQPAQAKAA